MFRQKRFVQGDDLGNISNRIFWKFGDLFCQEHISRGLFDAEIGRQDSNHDCVDPTLVKIVALNDEYGASVSWLRPDGRSKCGPPDLPALHYHSSSGMDSACAFSIAGSIDAFSDAYTLSSFSVIP